jgi:YHS domain-containing protein
MKNILMFISFLAIGLFITCCSNKDPKKTIEANVASVASADTSKFTPAMVDNKRDPSCGMPVAAGIGDTAHYKGKVFGFCSKECKDEFLKDPEKNITAADLKK